MPTPAWPPAVRTGRYRLLTVAALTLAAATRLAAQAPTDLAPDSDPDSTPLPPARGAPWAVTTPPATRPPVVGQPFMDVRGALQHAIAARRERGVRTRSQYVVLSAFAGALVGAAYAGTQVSFNNARHNGRVFARSVAVGALAGSAVGALWYEVRSR